MSVAFFVEMWRRLDCLHVFWRPTGLCGWGGAKVVTVWAGSSHKACPVGETWIPTPTPLAMSVLNVSKQSMGRKSEEVWIKRITMIRCKAEGIEACLGDSDAVLPRLGEHDWGEVWATENDYSDSQHCDGSKQRHLHRENSLLCPAGEIKGLPMNQETTRSVLHV
jgi:hypothetical protein